MASACDTQRPMTPISPESSSQTSGTYPFEDVSFRDPLESALHVIRTERDALTALEDLYASNAIAQAGFAKAVKVIVESISCRGRLIVSGAGKSGKIGEKMVATMNSLGIRSVFLHPTEALHGDLGMIGDVSPFSVSRVF